MTRPEEMTSEEWLTMHDDLIDPSATATVNAEILVERAAQDAKWGQQNHPDGTGPQIRHLSPMPGIAGTHSAKRLATIFTQVTNHRAASGVVTWRDIFLEEVFEALAEDDPAKLRTELLQVAAVAAAWAEAIDRRTAALVDVPSATEAELKPRPKLSDLLVVPE